MLIVGSVNPGSHYWGAPFYSFGFICSNAMVDYRPMCGMVYRFWHDGVFDGSDQSTCAACCCVGESGSNRGSQTRVESGSPTFLAPTRLYIRPLFVQLDRCERAGCYC